MIASLSGVIAAKGDRFLVLETGGIGYRVYATPSTQGRCKEGESLKLFTYHHISETANDLYGFSTLVEVEFFESLLSVSGIGPKTALNVMSIARLEELYTAIQNNDATILTKVSGIGKKTAERIVLELQGKIADSAQGTGTPSDDATVIDALVSLGYTRSEARDASRQIPSSVVGVSDRVREALKHVGRHAE